MVDDQSPDFWKWSRGKLQRQRDNDMKDFAMEPMRQGHAFAIIFGIPLAVGVLYFVTPDDFKGNPIDYIFAGTRHCTTAQIVEGGTVESAATIAIQEMGVDPAKVENLGKRSEWTEGFNGQGRIGETYTVCLDDARAKVTKMEKVDGN